MHLERKTKKPSLFSTQGLRLLASPRSGEEEGGREGGKQGGLEGGSTWWDPSWGGGRGRKEGGGGEANLQQKSFGRHLSHAEISHV
jgi:hypothetical protein